MHISVIPYFRHSLFPSFPRRRESRIRTNSVVFGPKFIRIPTLAGMTADLTTPPNTDSNGMYISSCRAVGARSHPARFPTKLPEFFIRFLTDPEDLVVDIFSGSNATGWSAESEKRRWLACDSELEYVATSAFRFLEKGCSVATLREVYDKIRAFEYLNIDGYIANHRLL